MITIIGGSGSGKSEYAENVAKLNSGKKLYLATMMPYGEEGARRVQKHRAQREGKGFDTLESYLDIQGDVKRYLDSHGSVEVLLLECMSNYVANLLFAGEPMRNEDVISKIKQDLDYLQSVIPHIYVVTLNIFEDGVRYEESTENYREVLAEVNRLLAQESGTLLEIVAGQVVSWK